MWRKKFWAAALLLFLFAACCFAFAESEGNRGQSIEAPIKEAEVTKRIELYNQRPLRKFISVKNTEDHLYAEYTANLRKRIKASIAKAFPEHAGERLYGKVVVLIPVLADGTIYKMNGGIRILEPSGNRHLDQAAYRIVEKAAPFGQVPVHVPIDGKLLVWEFTETLQFKD